MAKPITYCSVEDCSDRVQGHGYCNKHYRRWKRTGDPLVTRKIPRQADHCTALGCSRPCHSQNLCSMHYQRFNKYGDATVVKERVYTFGPDHYAFGGEAAAYRTVHGWLSRYRGSAADEPCYLCGNQAEQWAYDHHDPNEKAALMGGLLVPYSTNLDHYVPLCQPCHRRVDQGKVVI